MSLLSPTRATASRRSKHSPQKRDLEASSDFEEVTFQTPKRSQGQLRTTPRLWSPSAKIATITNVQNLSPCRTLTLAALFHAVAVIAATSMTHERPLNEYDVIAVACPGVCLFATKTLPHKFTLSWRQPFAAAIFVITAISFVLQSLVAYKSLLVDRAYDFTCFSVTISFLMFCRATQLPFLYAMLTAAATLLSVVIPAATLNVFHGSIHRNSLITDGVTLAMIGAVGYSVWLAYRRTVPLSRHHHVSTTESTPSVPKGGSPTLSTTVCPPTQPRVTFTPAPFTTHFNDPMDLSTGAHVQSSPAAELPTATPEHQPQVIVASTMTASHRKPLGSSPLPDDYQPPSTLPFPEPQPVSAVETVESHHTEESKEVHENVPIASAISDSGVSIGTLAVQPVETECVATATSEHQTVNLTVNTSESAAPIKQWRSESVSASLSARSFGSTDSLQSQDSQDSTAGLTSSKSKETRKLLLSSLAERGYPSELLPTKVRQTEKLRSILHSFKQDVSANGLETARKHAWDLHNSRKSSLKTAGSENVAGKVLGGKVSLPVVTWADVCEQQEPFKPLGIATSLNAPRRISLIRNQAPTIGL